MLATAFVLWGAAVTWLEIAAFALALGCVVFNVLEIHWAWPLSIAASLLYGWLFFDSRLYGEASLQLFFVAVSIWGWWQWLFGQRLGSTLPEALHVAALACAMRWRLLAACVLAWPLLALALGRFTDTDVPWLDAFPTVGSIAGQLLLGRKFVETWPVWVIVNLFSVGLFAYKGLWLTAVLYVLFVVLAVVGWLRWAALLRDARVNGCAVPAQ